MKEEEKISRKKRQTCFVPTTMDAAEIGAKNLICTGKIDGTVGGAKHTFIYIYIPICVGSFVLVLCVCHFKQMSTCPFNKVLNKNDYS